MWSCEKCHHENEDVDDNCWSCGASSESILRGETSIDGEAPKPCLHCGANKVIPRVRVLDRDGDYHDSSLSVRIDRNPGAMLMKGTEISHLQAWICGSCGFTQLFATNPESLWLAHEIARGRK